MPIRKLPLLLVNQIAAGEVIERPASVVKELIENSLDAGATRIDIAIEDGGHQLIRIGDDGRGIPAEELPLAVTPHATSKLASADQLAAIDTLGFRGEALASIASISRLRLSSRAVGGGAGSAAAIEASGDQLSGVAPAASPGAPGTAIEIRDLFFNTPARRKFMRAASTEFGHIGDLVSRVAMVHPAVGFRLAHNGRTTLDLPPNQTPADRCLAILGKDLREGLLEFKHTPPPLTSSPPTSLSESAGSAGASIWGMAGLPSLARATAKFQYLCVNGRPIKDRSIAHAIKEAYRGLVPPDKQPMAVVFLTVDPASVDVNVHPTKAEVRFRNPSAIHGLVLSALRQRLLGADLTPKAVANGEWRMADGHAAAAAPSDARPPASSDDFVNYFRRMDPTQKSFVYEEMKRAVREEPTLADAAEPATAADSPPPAIRHHDILQIHHSYVVTQDDQGLLIVDQHALHERVMFEDLRRRVLGPPESAPAEPASAGGAPPPRRLESQRLLMPVTLAADADRQALLDELGPLLDRIGIEAAPIGPAAIAIQAFPSFLFDRKVDPAEFLGDLLDRAQDGRLKAASATTEEAALHEVLDMMACKAAVKAGDRMTAPELAALLQKRHEIERASNCPHGRPTTLRLSLKDLEKQFGRT